MYYYNILLHIASVENWLLFVILVKKCLKTNNAFETLFLLQLQWMALFQNVTIAEICWTAPSEHRCENELIYWFNQDYEVLIGCKWMKGKSKFSEVCTPLFLCSALFIFPVHLRLSHRYKHFKTSAPPTHRRFWPPKNIEN